MSLRSLGRTAAGTLLWAAALASPARAQSTVKAGTEFRVSQYTNGPQRLPAAAVAPDGTYLVAWESQFQDGDGLGVYGRTFDRAGVPLGPEFRISQSTLSDQGQPSVAVDFNGRFTVAWTGRDASGSGVFARQVAASGPLGSELQVNTYTTGEQTVPRVSANGFGFFVVWQSEGQDGVAGSVVGRAFTPSGAPRTDEKLLAQLTDRNEVQPAVAALPNANVAVAWRRLRLSGAPLAQVASRLYDNALTPLTDELNMGASGGIFEDRKDVTVVPVAFDHYAVSYWDVSAQSGKFGYISIDLGMQMQTFDAAGVGGPLVNTVPGLGEGNSARWEGAPSVGPAGTTLVAYTSAPDVITCFRLPPGTPPEPCVPVQEDGNGAGVFVQAVGPAASPTRVQLNTFTFADQRRPAVAQDRYGNAMVFWDSFDQDGSDFGVYGQRLGGLFPAGVTTDPPSQVLEPDVETAVRPSWRNQSAGARTVGGVISGYVGPPGGVYTIPDGSASYGTIADGATATCTDCYRVKAAFPSGRPAGHVDTLLFEDLQPAPLHLVNQWTLHVGRSFADVPSTSAYYRFIETLLHTGITAGCNAADFCPALTVTRDQMAVFVLRAKEGPAYLPPACTTPVFNDVPASSAFCRWVEELTRRGVTSGCGGGNYCPTAPVSRDQMAVFLLRTLEPNLTPPACTTPVFADVPANNGFCRWIEELARRGITSGCGGGNYCPTLAVTREQMAVFLTTTFGLRLD